MQGRPRKPTSQHILNGTFIADRHATNEPTPLQGIPPRPRHLSKYARQMWDRLIEVMGETGVITQADENIMALYCEAYSDWRQAKEAIEDTGPVLADEETGRAYKSPYRVILNEAAQQMATFGASLGLDPAARSRLKIDTSPPVSPVGSRNRNDGPPPPTESA